MYKVEDIKEYIIVYIKREYDYKEDRYIEEIRNDWIEAKSKKEALEKSDLECPVILNIIELEKNKEQ